MRALQIEDDVLTARNSSSPITCPYQLFCPPEERFDCSCSARAILGSMWSLALMAMAKTIAGALSVLSLTPAIS